MIAIYTTVSNGIAKVNWPGASFDYYWVVVNGSLWDGPIETDYIEIPVKSWYKTIQVIGSDNIDYAWQGDVLTADLISNSIYLKFGSKSGASAYRVYISGTAYSPIIEDNGSAEYTYQSSPLTASGLYTVDVVYRDSVGNWSPANHLYKIHMYVVPAGTDFTVAASTGVLTFTEA